MVTIIDLNGRMSLPNIPKSLRDLTNMKIIEMFRFFVMCVCLLLIISESTHSTRHHHLFGHVTLISTTLDANFDILCLLFQNISCLVWICFLCVKFFMIRAYLRVCVCVSDLYVCVTLKLRV